jgi:crotonobetaine/carnitine-CoA ligase
MTPSSTAPSARVLGDLLREHTEAAPDREFVQCGGDWMTLGELDRASDRVAAGLQQQGLRKGDRLALMLPNQIEYVVLIYACAKAGVVQVPINTYLRGEFLRHQLAQSQAVGIVADGLGLRQTVPLLGALPDLRGIILVGDPPDGGDTPATTLDYSALAGCQAELDRPEISPADLCVIMYTSGTTGPSKGCMISHGYYTFIATTFIAAGWFTPGDRIFGASPLFHFSGQVQLVENALVAGGSVVVEPSFSATTFMARARETGATALFGMGAMAVAVLAQPEAPGERDHSIRQASWIPMSEAMQQQFYDRFGVPVISEVYGQSECWPATLGVVGAERKPASLGQAIPGVEIRLVDEQDRPVPVGEVGEICIRTDRPHMMFDGYWNNPEATVETFRYLWHHTGDNGRFDEDGFLYFADRKKDSLRRRGENVSSIELEQAIMKHPAVAQAAAHAVPSELTEDDIKVCLVLAPGVSPTIHELFDFFKSCLPYYAVPRYVEFLDALPANVNGRVQKFVLRERGITAETIDLVAKGLVVDKHERRT